MIVTSHTPAIAFKPADFPVSLVASHSIGVVLSLNSSLGGVIEGLKEKKNGRIDKKEEEEKEDQGMGQKRRELSVLNKLQSHFTTDQQTENMQASLSSTAL